MPREDFEEVFTLTDADGIVTAIVTTRKNASYPRFACSFQREFEKGGQLEKTHWMLKRHLHALLHLIPEVIERLELEEEKIRIEMCHQRAAAKQNS